MDVFHDSPGVYVEEKSILPGSVAGVSTAIPAFIGYTKSAGVNGDLFYKPNGSL
jgi:phage tail sheath protein FI